MNKILLEDATMEALELTHGVVKVKMALANSKYIKWQMPEGDGE